jgi:hypothetical protein
MATADNGNTSVCDGDCVDRAASSSGVAADPYRYASFGHGVGGEEPYDVGEVGCGHERHYRLSTTSVAAATSATALCRCRSEWRSRFSRQAILIIGHAQTHSSINIALETSGTPLPPPPYDGNSTRMSTDTRWRDQHGAFTGICSGINITRERL